MRRPMDPWVADRVVRAVRLVLLLSAATGSGCQHVVLNPRLHDLSHAPSSRPGGEPLKVHMKSGELLVLESWRIADGGAAMEGTGVRYDVSRQVLGKGSLTAPLDQVALLESNDREAVGNLASAGLVALTTVWGTLSAICAIDPKSCFGSCPTFYLAGREGRPVAEGFSASIARSLEARDVDALPDAAPRGGRLRLVMRNEALETHAIRRLRLLAVPKPAGGRVFAAADGRFFPATRWSMPISCVGPEGDCLPQVSRADGSERGSAADGHDLAAREELTLTFGAPPPRAGLVIGARQTLMTTFVFYQTLAFLGNDAGEWLAAMERGGPDGARPAMAMARILGGIEAEVAEADGSWRPIGRFDEAGPISGDVQVIPLEAPSGPLRVRLRMAKGHWRIDWVAVADLQPPASPRTIDLERVERASHADPEALSSLRGERRRLITLPGDEYQLSFRLDGAPPSELFLESEGYYYEWLRGDWLREADPAMVALIARRPVEALRRLAGPFKAREADADMVFWNSRFAR
jgi:hypothetical protein